MEAYAERLKLYDESLETYSVPQFFTVDLISSLEVGLNDLRFV